MKVENEIRQSLESHCQAEFMELINESHMHNVPPGSESHFKLTLVSDAFVGKRLVQRHQYIYQVLAASMEKIHALALHLYTSEEWQEKQSAPLSPKCMGGE
ncbi:BolA/IbaG family iron-sulfur metabolism protein [Marinomonas agarivorans]|nr:BolA/IbaG family iron-sulfur metabolism protein [Marinomonas agarivorans]